MLIYCAWEFGARAIRAEENEDGADEEEARRAWIAARTPLFFLQVCIIAGAISPAVCFGVIGLVHRRRFFIFSNKFDIPGSMLYFVVCAVLHFLWQPAMHGG